MVRTTYDKALASFPELYHRVAQNGETVVVDRGGRGNVAMIAADELRSMMETIHLLRATAIDGTATRAGRGGAHVEDKEQV